ncbi:MAG: RHS repeat protein, partial [Sphingomonadales bacterium]|nr:RHS repeat protein [Sphingomonadales bacterium]
RGNMVTSLNYALADAAGNGIAAEGYGQTGYVYDANGRLLSRTGLGQVPETFVYDGMDRVVASTDLAGGTTSVVFNDAATQTVVTLANGLTKTSVYNLAGDLITSTESASINQSDNWAADLAQWGSFYVDRTAAAPIAGQPAYLFTTQAGAGNGAIYSPATSVEAGETVSFQVTLQATGGVTSHMLGIRTNGSFWGGIGEYGSRAVILDGPGQLQQHAQGFWYVTGLSETVTTTITISKYFHQNEASVRGYVYVDYPSGTEGDALIVSAPILTKSDSTYYQYDKLGRVRVMRAVNGSNQYYLYDAAGRKTADISHSGDVVEYRYDNANRVVAQITYNGRLTAAQLTALSSAGDYNSYGTSIASIRPAAQALDIWTWNIYDAGGRVQQTIDGLGNLVSFEYDASDRLVKTTSYATKLAAAAIIGLRQHRR